MSTDDYADRFILSGYWGASSLWVELEWENRNLDAPFTLPDGRDVTEVIEQGLLGSIADQLWLSISNPGKAGDLLWTSSMAFTAVSGRMLDALIAAGMRDMDIVPLTIRGKRAPDRPVYHLVVAAGDDPARPVREFPAGRRSTCQLDVHTEALQELRRQGIDRYRVKDVQQYLAELAEDLANEIDEPTNEDASLWKLDDHKATEGSVLGLRIPDGIESGQFLVPPSYLPPSTEATSAQENPDASWSWIRPDGTVARVLSVPSALDASGTPLNAWWFEDSGQLHLNVDHFSGVHAYPVTVQAILR